MFKAVSPPTTSRRRLLAATPAALALPGAALAAPAASSPDAELIRVCQQFAEVELASWYRYVVAPDDLADVQDAPPDGGQTAAFTRGGRRRLRRKMIARSIGR